MDVLTVFEDGGGAVAFEDGDGNHLAAGGSAGVHGFIVEDNPHVAPSRLFNGKTHVSQEFVAHPPQMSWESGARVNDEGVDAVGLKVIKLPRDLGLTELIIPKPERGLRELPCLGCVTMKHLCQVSMQVVMPFNRARI